MNLYTIGFTKKSAKEFFQLLQKNNIDLLLDIRLNNKSQLSGFAKGKDLEYFLDIICNCKYKHCLEYAPSKTLLDEYKKKNISWNDYVKQYNHLLLVRNNYKDFSSTYKEFKNICLLCSEPTANKCHRRLLAEILSEYNPQINIKHL